MTIPKTLLDQVKQECDLTTDQTRKVCDAFMSALVNQVKTGKSASFSNCVTFKRVLRGDRNHKNPKTGVPIFKKAHYVMSMDVKPALRKEFEDIVVTEEDKEKALSGGDVDVDAVDAVDAADDVDATASAVNV